MRRSIAVPRMSITGIAASPHWPLRTRPYLVVLAGNST